VGGGGGRVPPPSQAGGEMYSVVRVFSFLSLFIHSFIHSFLHSFTHSLIHSFIQHRQFSQSLLLNNFNNFIILTTSSTLTILRKLSTLLTMLCLLRRITSVHQSSSISPFLQITIINYHQHQVFSTGPLEVSM